MIDADKNLCVLCGKNPATTKDHIPPKAIFNSPRPSDLITVPACKDCNQGASVLDERFKSYLGMHVAQYSKQGEALFKQAVRTVKHNRKLKREIIDRTKPVDVSTESGIVVDKHKTILWDSEAHDKVIERIIRGLFYHHYQTILGHNAEIKVYWFKEFPLDTSEAYRNKKTIGGDAFVYYYDRADDSEFVSIWIFEFYGSHWAGGITQTNRS